MTEIRNRGLLVQTQSLYQCDYSVARSYFLVYAYADSKPLNYERQEEQKKVYLTYFPIFQYLVKGKFSSWRGQLYN